MKEILAELYNKVICFFQTEKSENTKDIASNRLKLVLMHDRTKLDPLTLDKMRYELIDVISKYIVIDKELLELNLAGEGDSIALMLNIPVVRTKSEKELLEEAEQKELDEPEMTEDSDNDDEDEEENVQDSDLSDDEESEVEVEIDEENNQVESKEDEDEESDIESDETSLEEPENTEEIADEGFKNKKSSKKTHKSEN